MNHIIHSKIYTFHYHRTVHPYCLILIPTWRSLCFCFYSPVPPNPPILLRSTVQTLPCQILPSNVRIYPSMNVKPMIAIFSLVVPLLKVLTALPVSIGVLNHNLPAVHPRTVAKRLSVSLRLPTVYAGFSRLEPFLMDGLNVHQWKIVSRVE